MNRVAREAAVAPVRAYQRLISPLLGQRCRFEPSCSRYAVQAIREYGILRGFVLAAWRLARCHPFSRGGFDPLTAQRLFAARSHEH
jgi:putative membrane protein insertion efficiency factor